MPHAVQIRQTGGHEVLNWTLIEVGEPGSGQVRLRLREGAMSALLSRMLQTSTWHWKRAQPRAPPS